MNDSEELKRNGYEEWLNEQTETICSFNSIDALLILHARIVSRARTEYVSVAKQGNEASEAALCSARFSNQPDKEGQNQHPIFEGESPVQICFARGNFGPRS